MHRTVRVLLGPATGTQVQYYIRPILYQLPQASHHLHKRNVTSTCLLKQKKKIITEHIIQRNKRRQMCQTLHVNRL